MKDEIREAGGIEALVKLLSSKVRQLTKEDLVRCVREEQEADQMSFRKEDAEIERFFSLGKRRARRRQKWRRKKGRETRTHSAER